MFDVAARAVRFVAPFVDRNHINQYWRGVQVTPASNKLGGALVIGTDGYVLAVMHDPSGTADKPYTIDVPADAQRACRARAADQDTRVVRFSTRRKRLSVQFASASPRSNRALWRDKVDEFPSRAVDLASLLPKQKQPRTGVVTYDPHLLVARLRHLPSSITFYQFSASGPTVVRMPLVPEFFALVMPQHQTPPAPIPEWLLTEIAGGSAA